jgi:hypothetical protein
MSTISLSDVKTYLGITDTSEDDKLNTLIAATNLTIDKYVGWTLAETEYTDEIYDGPGTEALCLKNRPITEIAEITVFDIAVEEVTNYYDYGWYLKDNDSGIVWNNLCWPPGRGIIKVSYTAGFDPIPADIFLGALEMVKFYRETTEKTGILSEVLGDYSISAMTGLNNMQGELTIPSIAFKMCLDFYKETYHPFLVY